MPNFDQRVARLDLSLFEPIESQSTQADRKSLLAIQRAVRTSLDGYVYLEIGSHLGGSLQTHLADPDCQLIYSIDTRPRAQPDERGNDFIYEANSTHRMLDTLRFEYPETMDKLITIERDAKSIDRARIERAPDLCFIDAEHTNAAAFADFRFCLDVASPNAVICFHDANLIFEAIANAKQTLENEKVNFHSMKLGGTVHVFLLRDAAHALRSALSEFAIDEDAFFRTSRISLSVVRQLHRCRNWFSRLAGAQDGRRHRRAG